MGLGHCDWVAGILCRRRCAVSAARIGVRQRIDATPGDIVFHGGPHEATVPADPDYFGRDGYWIVRGAVYFGSACDCSNRWKSWASAIHRAQNWKTLERGSVTSSVNRTAHRRE